MSTQYSSLVKDYSDGTRQVFEPAEYRERLISWMGLQPGIPRKILDLGCGDGIFTQFLSEEFSGGVQVVGIDNTPEMIQFAQDMYSDIDFRCEDMDSLSLADNEVDLIFSRFTVHYSRDLAVTMKEMARVTKPGGLFFLKDIHPFYATFHKESLDYERKEDVTFITQGDTGVKVTHPTFTFEEYFSAFLKTGWTMKMAYEIYGRDAHGEKIKPFRVPTSVCYILQKR